MSGLPRTRVPIVICTLLLTQFILVPPAQARQSCNGKRATKVGTDEPERIRGTKGNDVIVAGKGADLVRGGGGNDTICGGGGADLIIGGAGNDVGEGQAGIDQLAGGAGNDTLTVGPGFFQFVMGGGGDDRLVGNENFVFTSYFKSPSGVSLDLANGVASGGQGNDELVDIAGAEGSSFDDTIAGNTGLNFLFGLEGNDTMSSGGNGGTLESLGQSGGNPSAGAEYDFLGGGPGNDSLNGDTGLDVVTFDSAEGPVDANLTTGTAIGEGNDTVSGVEIVLGTPFEDTLTGDEQANGFESYGGADTVDGKGGDDVSIFFDSSGVSGDLAAGTASAQYESSTELGSISDTSTDTLKSIEGLWGSAFDDSLAGDLAANDLRGLPGDDELSGAAGDDRLVGGEGTDSADGGDGDDQCDAETETTCESDPSAPASRAPWVNLLDRLQLRGRH